MSIFEKLRTDPLFRRGLGLIMSGLLLAFMAFSWTLAWFANNERVSGGGMSFETDSSNIYFDDYITVRRKIASIDVTTVYKRDDSDRVYYEYDVASGTYVTEEPQEGGTAVKKRLEISGILPGEYFYLTIKLRRLGEKPLSYAISMNGIDDSLGKFNVGTGENIREHSVLGIYKTGISLSIGETVEEDVVTNEQWLGLYNEEGDDELLENVELVSLTPWAATLTDEGGAYIPITIRIVADLTNYYTLRGTTSNLLSEKYFSVDSISVTTEKGAGV